MSNLQLTKEFREATAAISRDILQNPQKYKQAGEWLDQYYDKEFCQNKMHKRSDMLVADVFINGPNRHEYYCPIWHSSGCPTIKAYEILQAVAMVEFNHFVSMWDILEKDYLFDVPPGSLTYRMAEDIVATRGRTQKSYAALKDRLWLAHKEILEIKEQCKFIGQKESMIACLLTWLLANPDVHRAALGITAFDKWEWYSSYESGVCSQRADVIQLLDTCEMLQDWQNLTYEAWQNIENKRIAEAEQEQSSKHIKEPVVTEQGEKQDNEVYQNNHQSNHPYEINLLEEIVDKLESWAEERKTGFEAKIEEERASNKHPKTLGDFLKEHDTFSSILDLSPLAAYFALPDLSEKFDFVVKSLQYEDNFAPATMLVETQNGLYHENIEIVKLAAEIAERLDSYEPESFEYKSRLVQCRTFFAVTVPGIAERIRKIGEMTKNKIADNNQTLPIKKTSDNKTAVTKQVGKRTVKVRTKNKPGRPKVLAEEAKKRRDLKTSWEQYRDTIKGSGKKMSFCADNEISVEYLNNKVLRWCRDHPR